MGLEGLVTEDLHGDQGRRDRADGGHDVKGRLRHSPALAARLKLVPYPQDRRDGVARNDPGDEHVPLEEEGEQRGRDQGRNGEEQQEEPYGAAFQHGGLTNLVGETG